MTDNEIIKALECCVQYRTTDVRTYKGLPLEVFSQAVLDLINRQKEDIDELEAIVDLRSKRKYYQKFVKEVYQKEKGNKLAHPDFDYIYKLYFEQKAEIERYKEYYETMEIEIYSFRKDQADVKFLKNKIRAEAIKEFAERLKEEMTDKKYKYITETNYSKTVNSVIDSCVISIDTLVKEMTEEKK